MQAAQRAAKLSKHYNNRQCRNSSGLQRAMAAYHCHLWEAGFLKTKIPYRTTKKKIPQRPRITYNQELQLVAKALQLILNCSSKAVKSATMEA